MRVYPIGSSDSDQLLSASQYTGAGPPRGLKRKQHHENVLQSGTPAQILVVSEQN